MKKNAFYEVYENLEYKVVFEEDDEAIFYALKYGEEMFNSLMITIYKKENSKYKNISNYHVSWDKEVTGLVISSFIRRFLEDVPFRDKYYVSGEKFASEMRYSDIDGINKKCREEIMRFNKIRDDKKKFKDYCNIKTHGMDKFSRMKLNNLMERISKEDVDTILVAFEDEKNVANALKWCCRGLSVNDAIRKVKVDLEVAKNVRR